MPEDDEIENFSDDILYSPSEVADPQAVVNSIFSEKISQKFEIYSYRNAAIILKNTFPSHFLEICKILESFSIDTRMIRSPGKNKSEIALYVDTLFSDEWQEARIRANLNVELLPARIKKASPFKSFIREGFLDGHRIDFLNGKVAVDLEWNSKDQTYDRDLYAFSAYYQAGAIDLGIILTRGTDLDTEFFRKLGPVLKKDGSDGKDMTYKKFGASTTWMGKLLYRLEAGRNGGCPILAIGITRKCINDI